MSSLQKIVRQYFFCINTYKMSIYIWFDNMQFKQMLPMPLMTFLQHSFHVRHGTWICSFGLNCCQCLHCHFCKHSFHVRHGTWICCFGLNWGAILALSWPKQICYSKTLHINFLWRYAIQAEITSIDVPRNNPNENWACILTWGTT